MSEWSAEKAAGELIDELPSGYPEDPIDIDDLREAAVKYLTQAHDAGMSEGALIGHMQQAAELNDLRRKAREMEDLKKAAWYIACLNTPTGEESDANS